MVIRSRWRFPVRQRRSVPTLSVNRFVHWWLIRRRARLAALVCLLALVAGCTKLGPDFTTPPAPDAEDWLEADDAKVKPETEDYSTWWTVFDDPVLNKLIDIAYKQNLPLQIAGIRIFEARARLGIAVGNQYPQAQDATASLSQNKLSKNAANVAGLDRNYQSAHVGFDQSWEIDFWGRFQRGIESADATLGATIADYDALLVSLTAEVASTYVRIRELEELLVLTQKNVELQARTLQITEAQFRGGIVSESGDQQRSANIVVGFFFDFDLDDAELHVDVQALFGTLCHRGCEFADAVSVADRCAERRLDLGPLQ